MDLMIPKGSVAVDGVSLTIVNVEQRRFSVSLIPTTLQRTNLKNRRAGDKVNLEADIICKCIKKRCDEIITHKTDGNITIENVRKLGFS